MSEQRKILLHLHTPPIPVDGGDKRRLTGILQYFRERQNFFAVDALAANDFHRVTWTQERQQAVLKFVDQLFIYDSNNFFDFLYSRSQSFYYQTLRRQQMPIDSDYFTPPGYLNFVKELLSRQYDFLWINYIEFAHLAVQSNSYRALLDMHDLGCQGRLAKQNVFPFKGLKFDYQSNFVREVKLLEKFDTVIVNSQQELAILESHLPSHKLCLVPHLVEDVAFSSLIPYSRRQFQYDLLFVGTSRSPNVDGLNFFISAILPIVIHQKPETRLALAGTVAQVVQVNTSLAQNIDFVGYVPSLANVYLKSKIVICPLLEGAGTKVKLQEAMAYAIPVVTTTIGAAGMNFTDGVNAFVTDDPVTFAQQIVRLLEKPELAQKLSTEASVTFAKDYSNSAVYSKLDRLFDISPS